MALPPSAAAAPPMPLMDQGAMPPGEDIGTEEAPIEDEEPSGKVLCTILGNPDGSFTLVRGDEPEPGEMGAEGEPPAPAGEDYDAGREGVGQMFKAIHEIINAHEDGTGDGQSDEAAGDKAFDEGYGATNPPANPGLADKF